jgi:uncharacterized protein
VIRYSYNDGSLTLAVIVVSRASRTEIAGAHDGALKVRIAAPPVDGAANEELKRALAKFFQVAPGKVEITSGLSSKRKTVRLSGVDPTLVAGILETRI